MPTIANTLGVGSGVDTKVLIEALVNAEQSPRSDALKARADATDARISGLSQVQSGLDALVTALASRTRGGALGPLPQTSDSSVVAATATAGSVPGLQATALEVRALAAGQTLVSASLGAATDPVGTGTLTLRVGTMTDDGQGGFSFASGAVPAVDIAIAASNNSVTGLRDAINAAQLNVHASLIDDGSGMRLVLKGQDGAASAFILTAQPDAGVAGLERFVHRPGQSAMTVAASAADAVLSVDGITVKRPTNSISDIVTGVRLDLRRASPGTVVQLSASRDPAGLTTALGDLTGAINALQSLGASLTKPTDSQGAAGALLGDANIRGLRQKLASLTATPLVSASGNAPTRLSDLGIGTSRTGAMTIDDAKLSAMIAAHADVVEAMLTSLTADGRSGGATGALVRLQRDLASATGATAGTTARLTREKSRINSEQAALSARMTNFRTQLTRQYAAMESAVTVSKSVQSFLEAQVKAWNQSNN